MVMICGLIWDPSFWVTTAEMTGLLTPHARPRAENGGKSMCEHVCILLLCFC